MMNKNGQVLVVFVLILPLILTFLGLIIDIGNSLIIRKKYENVIKDEILYSYKKDNADDILVETDEISYNIETDESFEQIDNQNIEDREIDLNLLEKNIKENIKNYEEVKINIDDDILTVNVKYYYKSIFGTLFNIGLNNIDIKVKYDIKNKKIVRE